jgi:hypothetical protein
LSIDPRRLRRGEIVAGAGGALLLVFLFTPAWYALNGTLRQTAGELGAGSSWNGWWGLAGLRWLVLATILVALALAWFQAAQPAPAIPVTVAVLVTVLGGLSAVAVVYRILAGPPSGGSLLHQRAGPYLALVAAIATAYGGYASMREESGTDPAVLEIETVRLTGPKTGARPRGAGS